MSSDISLGNLISRWRLFVEQCEEGYDWTIYEFDEEISVRDEIESADKTCLNTKEELEFKSNLFEIDTRFKSLLNEDAERPDRPKTWWSRGILKKAGVDYKQDIQEFYKVFVDDIE
jgi:hypothetical protein